MFKCLSPIKKKMIKHKNVPNEKVDFNVENELFSFSYRHVILLDVV